MAERNPYHLPKGTPEGGQFTTAQLDTIAGAARIGAGLMKNKYGRKKPSPGGLYEGKFIPEVDDLSYNTQREKLALDAMKYMQEFTTRYYELKGKIIGAELQGSFLSDKEFPKDIDIILKFKDNASMNFFATRVLPSRTWSRVEFGFWTEANEASKLMHDLYNEETRKRYDIEPVDISSWLK